MEKIENWRKVGKIAREVREYAKQIIKPNMKLLDIAEKIEGEIEKLGAKPAFPINLCINEIAAHYTPSYNDETLSTGLLKVDIGIHVEGAIADTAFSIDLENSEENRKLIQASEEALKAAIKIIKKDVELNKVGKSIHDAITGYGFSPIRNLSGHQIEKYNLHAGLTIPNYDNNNKTKLPEGIYAIEPFATTGAGIVYDGKPSGIYRLEEAKQTRDNFDRQVLAFIAEEYSTLPFCSRWLVKKFSTRALISLARLEQEKILHQYSQLVEKAHGKVSQAEHTVIINKEVEITTA